ncbi:hypothetical protein ACFQ9R_11765 [Nocardia sp. NPDC056541]|uniref:hypothetical protein n=1 Tax=Nocardia sp. NPDC056541 TaxID=3345860 RepID=UPI00366C5C26
MKSPIARGNPVRQSGVAGLQARVAQKPADIDAKLAKLTAVRDTLRAALAAGFDDLLACSESPTCPVSLDDLNRKSSTGESGCGY